MKSTKKLVMATLLLVLALTAVVSSTFAWFTIQANPEIENIKVNVTSGEGLRMSIAGENGDYKSIWTEAEFKAQHPELDSIELQSITPQIQELDGLFSVKPNLFQKIQYVTPKPADGENPAEPGYYTYENSDANKDFLQFDLWFEADRAVDVYLHVGIVTNAIQDDTTTAALDCARFGFGNYLAGNSTPNEFFIFNPRPNSAPFGSGSFFDYNHIRGSFWEMTEDANPNHLERALLKEGAPGIPFVMAETDRLTANQNATYDVASEKTLLSIPDKGTKIRLTVSFWLEGWDGDCTDAAKGAEINIFVRFIGHSKPDDGN